jgi:threonine dehydrogenase-like Zn-dependent dehydrogenase
VHVYDHNDSGPKPELVRALGGTYHSGALDDLAEIAPDVVMECTAVPDVIAAMVTHVAPDSVICLTGVGSSHKSPFDIGTFNRDMVLNNGTVFGTVNANRHHYAVAADVIARADRTWLSRLITRRVPLANFADALKKQKGDIKVVIDFTL